MSDVVERFMRYVQVDSQSDPDNEAQTPSAPTQHKMAEVMGEELRSIGCIDVKVDEHAYVTGTLPASKGAEDAPALMLCAHLDTAKDAPASGVKPHIVHYEGGPLVANPELAHPTIKVAFVPDEEIGHGAELLDLDALGAKWGYTVDGEALGEFNYECFSASEATVTFKGVVVHPGSAKNIMVNAITLASEFQQMVPAAERPEHTEGREGYYHPTDISGTPDEVKLCYILRDFDAADFDEREATLRRIAAFQNARYGEGTVTVEVRQQYRNMAEKFGPADQLLIDYAVEANREVGIEPVLVPARGGTDGAQLTFRGLPCPNIATGGYNAHSVREFVPVRSLELTVDLLERLVAKFAAVRADGTVATPTAGAADGE